MAEAGDEIAELEKLLTELKRAEAEKQAVEEAARLKEAAAREQDAAVSLVSEPEFDLTTMSSRRKVATVKAAPPAEFLSESWKESESGDESGVGITSGDGGGLPIAQIGGGLLALVLLFVFAQVPIGQTELDKVTYGGAPTRLESTDEIRARYEFVTGGQLGQFEEE